LGIHEEQEEGDVFGHIEVVPMSSPASLGYRMPAEWERHQGTWLSWPKDPNTFPGDILPAVEEAYVNMVVTLARGEDVHVLVDDQKAEARVKAILKRADRVSFHLIRTVDVWVRDYGPIYVRGKDLAVIKWVFNAWGNRYDDLKPDNESGEVIAKSTGLKVFRPGVVLEGGSIDSNGKGTLLTTEQCLLNPNRNPGFGKAKLTTVIEENLGVRHVVWLKEGIEGDDTDGHVDDIARFVGPRAMVAGVEPNENDSNHKALETNLKLLRRAKDQDGMTLDVVEVPMPEKVYSAVGRLPASHLNFYIGNEAVIVPTFGGDSDAEAIRTLEKLFPHREVAGIDCRALVYGLGTLHCVTQQIPGVDQVA
jgi:agmatine deiminase